MGSALRLPAPTPRATMLMLPPPPPLPPSRLHCGDVCRHHRHPGLALWPAPVHHPHPGGRRHRRGPAGEQEGRLQRHASRPLLCRCVGVHGRAPRRPLPDGWQRSMDGPAGVRLPCTARLPPAPLLHSPRSPPAARRSPLPPLLQAGWPLLWLPPSPLLPSPPRASTPPTVTWTSSGGLRRGGRAAGRQRQQGGGACCSGEPSLACNWQPSCVAVLIAVPCPHPTACCLKVLRGPVP